MADNELALPGGGINALTVSEALTERLESVLLGATDAKAAARTIAGNPKLLAEAREKLSLVSRLAAPITPDELYVCLQPLVLLHGVPDFGQDDAAADLQVAWFDIYVKALQEHPKEAIEIAVFEAIRLRKYDKFPLPGYLNELATESTTEIRLIAFRLRYAVEKGGENRPPRKRTAEDAQVVGEMLADLRGPDGRIHLAKSASEATPPTDRRATAEALRRLAGYR